MAGSRALPDLIARIRVDSSGVDAALSNLTQGFGKANLGLVGLAAGFGLVLIGGKSMIDISEQMKHAEGDLTSAINARNSAWASGPTQDPAVLKEVAKATEANVAAQRHLAEVEAGMPTKHKATALELMHLQDAQQKASAAAAALAAAQAKLGDSTQVTFVNTAGLKTEIDAFVKKNAGYISNLADVTTGYASLVREGVPAKDLTRDMGIALNISAAEGISLSEAVGKLQSAEAGRSVGLKKLVGITLETVPATATLAEKEAILERNMVKVNAAFDGATAAVPPLTQNSNKLGIIWQELSEKDGPNLSKGINDMENSIIKSLPTWLNWLDTIGRTSDAIMGSSVTAHNWIAAHLPGGSVAGPVPYVPPHRASGGPVLPNSIYTVGENGPETLVMGARGGTVIPNGGNTYHTHLTLNGSAAVNNPDAVRSMLQRMERLGAAG